MVDFGDAPVLPADPARTHAAIEATVGAGARRGRDPDRPRRRPLDRGAGHPRVRREARPGRADPLRHAHGHRHRGLRRRGLPRHADVPARRGRPRRPDALRADRAARLLARRDGVRAGRRSAGSRASSCTTCASCGIRRGRRRRARRSSAPGPVFLSVDVDVLDPAFAPGTGTPEPGGMTSRRPALGLPRARRRGRARRRRRRRGVPDRGRLGRHHRARRRPDRARDPHGHRAARRRR